MKNRQYRDYGSEHKHKAVIQKLLACATAKCEQPCHEHHETKQAEP
jgi:hypothetical protein